jgi:(p)ppGpp synthase/HD superfamily hydrolase
MATLERAIEIAARAHSGQRDKAGAPYILHPLRVMLRAATDAERIAAVLHDVVEDSDWTFDQLRAEGFAPEVVEAVDALTRRPGETYEEFVLRAGAHPLARRVKLADLADNSDPNRITSPTEQDLARLERYRRAIALLTAG